MSEPTWVQLVDDYLDANPAALHAGFTRRDMASWWVSQARVNAPDSASACRSASRALAEYLRRQAVAPSPFSYGYQPRRVLRSEGYGPRAVWSVVGPADARRTITLDANDAAGRLVRDVARHARPAAEPDPAMQPVVEGTIAVVEAQLQLMLQYLAATA